MKNMEVLNVRRLYAAMLAARAVQELFPGTKLGLSAVTEQGFYYDLDVPGGLSEADIPRIEAEMRRIAAAGPTVERRRMPREAALCLLLDRGERWKAEWLGEMLGDGDEAVIVAWGEYVDAVLNVPEEDGSSAALPAFRLLNVSGAYWRGDSRNPMLQRVYGAAFADEAALEAFLAGHEEAMKRDHRKLGKQQELFLFAEEAPGMPFYLPNGTVVRNELERLAREYMERYGYEEVRTPMMMDRRMWEQSGHWEHYRDNMYFSELDHHAYAVKPMNCPGHMLIFKHKRRSYRELPLRLAEFGQVHRHEFSGALNGLFRVRTFCQDDAHIFAAPEMIEDEVKRTVALIRDIYAIFGFEYRLGLSTRPDDSMGSDAQWESAESALSRVLDALGMPYSINPGDGAFYGPKIDFHIKDALNRSHQCGTIQLDFQMPEKFDLGYVDERNERQTPIVIHRAVYGSIDRFFAILLEHYAGAWPVWLAPIQAMVLPVAERHAGHAAELCARLKTAGIRAETDERGEKLGYKIREAELQKVPYVLVVGDKETASGSVSVRVRGAGGSQRDMGAEEFIALVSAKAEGRGGTV